MRPEDIIGTAVGAADCIVAGRVNAVLPVGSDQYLDIRVEDTECFFRVPKNARFQPGEPAFIALDPTRLHLFDKESGRSLFQAPLRPQAKAA